MPSAGIHFGPVLSGLPQSRRDDCAHPRRAMIPAVSQTSAMEEIMGHLILQGDDTTWNGFSLLGESSLAITLDETGAIFNHFNALDFLVLSGTTSVSIAST